MAERWADVEELLLGCATDDLEATDDVTPVLVAFRGEDLLAVNWLRPFPRREHHDAILEACGLAAALGADRLALSFGARVWSLEDPVVPVVPEGDLRQRAVFLHLVDASVDPPQARHVLHPFDVHPAGLSWGVPLREDAIEGWVPATLARYAGARGAAALPDGEVVLLLHHLTTVGHDPLLSREVARRLGATVGG